METRVGDKYHWMHNLFYSVFVGLKSRLVEVLNDISPELKTFKQVINNQVYYKKSSTRILKKLRRMTDIEGYQGGTKIHSRQ